MFIKPHTLEGWEHLSNMQTEQICDLTRDVFQLREYAGQLAALLKPFAEIHIPGDPGIDASDYPNVKIAVPVADVKAIRAALSKNTETPKPSGVTPYRGNAESGKGTDERVEGPQPTPKFGCGASRSALADDLRARGDELSLEAADFIDCSHRKRQRLVWWPDGRPALHTEYHDGGWGEHAIDAEPKAVLGVRTDFDAWWSEWRTEWLAHSGALDGAAELTARAAWDVATEAAWDAGWKEGQHAYKQAYGLSGNSQGNQP